MEQERRGVKRVRREGKKLPFSCSRKAAKKKGESQDDRATKTFGKRGTLREKTNGQNMSKTQRTCLAKAGLSHELPDRPAHQREGKKFLRRSNQRATAETVVSKSEALGRWRGAVCKGAT